MKRHFAIQGALALALIAYVSAGAQASPITFTYDWSPSSPSVSGQANMNAIDFSNQAANTVTTTQALGNASSISVANSTSDTLNNAAYSLGVKITDGTLSGNVSFNGELNGTITNGIVNKLTNTLISPATQNLILGGDKFAVTLTSFVPPNPFGAGNKPGGFGFEITAAPGGSGTPPPNNVPEPTTLLLSCLGAGGFALRALRKRGK